MNGLESTNQPANTSQGHQNFIDWMKAVGMFLIVFGHVVGPPFNQFTQPIYPKQLGVAFFLFITGWSLANDGRARIRVVFNRLFPVYLFGIGFALCLSILFLFTINDTNPSNYLPFFLGVNVLFNNFPANPTTWYIGTYLHFLFFWFFFLQGKTIKKRHLLVGLLCEVIFRGLILVSGKAFIAYMLLPNWFTVFLLGMFFAQKKDIHTTSKLKYLLPLWLGMFALWAFVTNLIEFDNSFPFRHFADDSLASAAGLSVLISFIYCIHAMLFFAIARRLPRLRSVSFFARNTLVIFILHMPLVYGFSPYVYSLFDSTFSKKLSLILILYIGLAFVSEIINRGLNIKGLREQVWNYLHVKLKVTVQAPVRRE